MRTAAGEVLGRVRDEVDARVLAPVVGSFIEGAKDTASMWVRHVDGRVFQIHVTELEPTDKELAYFAALSRLA